MLAGWLCFRLMIDLVIGLILGLAISRAELTGREVAIGFLG